MTFAQFLSILRARWRVVSLVLALTVATTLIVCLLLPKQYDAVASVVVDFKPDPLSAAVFGQVASPAVVATQVDIISSERVAVRVARMLKLTENPAIRQQWQDDGGEGTVEQWLIKLFKKNLDVEPSRDSSVIRIIYRAPDPRFAAGMANAFAQAYVDTSLELRTDPARQFSGFFDARVKEARGALEKAQAKLSSYQNQNGIVASDERLDVENARLNELNSQLTALQAIASESAIRQAQTRSGRADGLQEVLNNPTVAGLRNDINRSEAALQQLTTRLGDNHPQVRESRASLAELRARLDAEMTKVASSVDVTSKINRQRESELRAALDAQRAKIQKLKVVRDEALVLLQDVTNAQRSYDALLQRQMQTGLESQATLSNVNMLTQALPPVDHASPRILLYTLLSVFMGALLAVGTAVLLELIDRRVRIADDLVASLDLPVIGTLPKPGAKRWAAKKSLASPMQQRLLASVSPAAKGA